MLTRHYLITLILFFATTYLFPCTIGVSAGNSGNGGKPFIWKSRDKASAKYNRVERFTSMPISYIAVCDSLSDEPWMGVNAEGLAIVNALAYDLLPRDLNNPVLMSNALGALRSVDEFERYLNAHLIRNTAGNFAVIDAFGAAAMFEIGNTSYRRYDAATEESGYLVRTNFSYLGAGNDGSERFLRSEVIIDSLAASNQLTPRNVIKYQMRDFSDRNSQPYLLPYEQFQTGIPYGYIDNSYSVCRDITVSATVICGVAANDDPRYSVMWTALGNPATAVFLPYFAACQVPLLSSATPVAPLAVRAAELNASVKDENNLVDTFKLFGERAFVTKMDSLETVFFDALTTQLSSWQNPTANDFFELESNYTTLAYNMLTETNLHYRPRANFSYDVVLPAQINLYNTSLYCPTSVNWDLDGDGVFESGDITSAAFEGGDNNLIGIRVANEYGEDTFYQRINIAAAVHDEQIVSFNFGPNPAQKELTFSTQTDCELNIYNIKGQKIHAGKLRAGEKFTLRKNLSTGIYLVRVKRGNWWTMKKILVQK